jgi:hypothetical protein
LTDGLLDLVLQRSLRNPFIAAQIDLDSELEVAYGAVEGQQDAAVDLGDLAGKGGGFEPGERLAASG